MLLELRVNQWAGLLTKFQVDWWAGSPSEAQLHQCATKCATKVTALVSGQPVGSIASPKQGRPVGRVAC